MDFGNPASSSSLIPIPSQQPGTAHGPRYTGQIPGITPESSLREYWYILLKRKWSVFACLIIFVTVATVATFRMTPLYLGTARIVVNPVNPDFLGFKDGASQAAQVYDDRELDTQIRILQSEQIALQAVRTLHLEQHPQFAISPVKSRKLDAPAPSAEERDLAIAGSVRGALTVSIIPETRVVEIRYLSPDPRLAADVANGIANAYIEQNFRTKYESTMQAADWISKQLNELQLRVEASQERLARYQQENQIVGVDEKQNIITSKLDDLNRQLTAAEADRIQKEAYYRLNLVGTIDASPGTSGGNRANSLLENLRAQAVELRKQRAALTTNFGPSYPKVVEINNQLAQLDDAMQKELTNLATRLKNEYLAALQREKMLRQAFEAQKEEANRLNEKTAQYNMLRREAESNRQLYDGLLQKMKEAGISASLKSSNIRIMDVARPPQRPAKPDIPRNLAIAFLLGLSAGIGLAVTLEALDTSVHTAEQVESIAGISVLGVIPQRSGMVSLRKRHKHLPAAVVDGDKRSLQLVTHDRPKSEVSEAYRALRTSILLASPGSPPQVVLITSALPQEGKTTTSTNTAIVLAQGGRRVLLIDADMRRAGIHRAFGIPRGTGLSTVLTGNGNWRDVVVESPLIPNLHIILAGPQPPHPAELLGSPLMKELIAQWRENYDHIVIDTPPILSVTDAVLVAVESDVTVLVARAGETPKRALRRAREVLDQVGAPIMGAVLNAVNLTSPDSYYYYYYGSKYGGRYYESDESHAQRQAQARAAQAEACAQEVGTQTHDKS